MDSTLPHRPITTQNLIAFGTRFAPLIYSSANTGGLEPEVVMANENELFFLVLIIILTMIMHAILAHKGPGPGKKAH